MENSQFNTLSPWWLYRLLGWLERTPFRGWLLAAIIFVLGVVLMHLPLWLNGQIVAYQIDPMLIFPATWFPIGLVFWLWQDRVASRIIQDFGSGTKKSQAEITAIYTDFVSIPNRVAILLVGVGLVMGGYYSATQAQLLGVTGTLFVVLSSVVPTLGSSLELLGIWRWVKQLTHINRLYTDIEAINLFNLWPVYALSHYGYWLAMLAILSTVIIDTVVRLDGGNGLPIFQILYSTSFALMVFLVPLLGINKRLRLEKQKNLQRLGNELKSLYDEAEEAVHNRKLDKVSLLTGAANGLKAQIDTVSKVATWPWTPGSLRNLLLPIFLPLFIGILQRYVFAWLGLN